MARPRPRAHLHIRLTGGPCHGQEHTIHRTLWDHGTLHVYGETEDLFVAREEPGPWGPRPPVHAYVRTLMGYRPTGKNEKPRYWYEWHYDNPVRT